MPQPPLIRIPMLRRSFAGACTLEARAGTTGDMGGDAGNGGRSMFSLRNAGGFHLRPRLFVPVGEEVSLEVVVGGDEERRLLAEALRWIADVIDPEGATPSEWTEVE